MPYSVVAARFETFAAADSAAHVLFASHVPAEDVNVCFAGAALPSQSASSNVEATTGAETDDGLEMPYRAQVNVSSLSTIGAVCGAAVVLGFDGPSLLMLGAAALGAFVGSWTGAMWLATRANRRWIRRQNGHVLLTAHLPHAQVAAIAELLAEAGGVQIERSRGQWEHGRWVDESAAVSRVDSRRVGRHTPFA